MSSDLVVPMGLVIIILLVWIIVRLGGR